MITVFDAAGEGSAKTSWVLIRRARADRPGSDKFEPAARVAKPRPFKRLHLADQKTGQVLVRTSGQGKPTISGPKIGHLEKTGHVLVRNPGCEKPSDFSPGNRLSRKTGQVLVRTSGRGKPGDFSP